MLKQPEKKNRYDDDYAVVELLNDLYEDVTIAGEVIGSTGDILEEYFPDRFRDIQLDLAADDEFTIYTCPICGQEYDDYDEATYCCQEEEEEVETTE